MTTPDLADALADEPHVFAAELLASTDFTGEFFLTQIVSHHHGANVERFVKELERRDVRTPGMCGVFVYRSARPATLAARNASELNAVQLQLEGQDSVRRSSLLATDY